MADVRREFETKAPTAIRSMRWLAHDNNEKNMKTPTAEEIVAEAATLKKMKPTVLKSSAFGDNHHNAIDAQIEALEMRKSEEEIYDELADEADNVRDAALEAVRWMEGESEDGAPSDNWKSLVG